MNRVDRRARRWFWLALSWAALGLATAGAFLPLLPTTPFLLIALWSGSRASPRLRFRLYRHPRYGPPIKARQRHGAIPARAKWLACGMMAVSATILWLAGATGALMGAVSMLLTAVTVFVLSRPTAVEVISEAGP
jgi:hypothetical protein